MIEENLVPGENKGKLNTLAIVVVGGLVVLVGLGFMSTKFRNNPAETTGKAIVESTPTISVNNEVGTVAGSNTDSNSETNTVSITAGSFYFKPNEIRVKKGTKVKIILNSVDMLHDFNIDELQVRVPVTKSGNTSTAEFTANKAGSFEFYCSVGQHRAKGQVGKLIVEE